MWKFSLGFLSKLIRDKLSENMLSDVALCRTPVGQISMGDSVLADREITFVRSTKDRHPAECSAVSLADYTQCKQPCGFVKAGKFRGHGSPVNPLHMQSYAL